MNEREEIYYQSKNNLDKQIEKLSEAKLRKRNQLQNELEIQDSVMKLLDNIREREPEIEKNDIYVEAYYTVKESSYRIIDSREERYQQVSRDYTQAESDMEELKSLYYDSLEEDSINDSLSD